MLPPKSTPFLLALLLIAHVALAITYARVLPPLNWPDEPAHLNYAAALARGEGLSSIGPRARGGEALGGLIEGHFSSVENPIEDERLAEIQYEANQPPLFYLVASFVLRQTFVHGQAGLMGVRLLNLSLSCGSLIGVFFFVRFAMGRSDLALIATGFLALLPTRTFMAVSISNDPAIELVFVLFLAGLARSGLGGHSAKPRRAALGTTLALGMLFGIGLLTKATAAFLPALQLLWLRHARRPFPRLVPTLAIGLLIASPWLLRNISLYGWLDPLAIKAGALGPATELASTEITAANRPTLGVAGEYGPAGFFWTLFVSFWGVFGWMEMFPGIGLAFVYVALSAIALYGLGRTFLASASAAERESQRELLDVLVSCLGATGIFVVATLVYGLFDYQPQGRYLNPVSAPLALLVAVGWRQAVKRFGGALAITALGVLGIANLYNVLYVIPWYLEP